MRYTVAIKPNSRKGPLVEPQEDGSFIVYVRERAVEGEANKALIALLSKHFDTPKTLVVIVMGQTSRRKLVDIRK